MERALALALEASAKARISLSLFFSHGLKAVPPTEVGASHRNRDRGLSRIVEGWHVRPGLYTMQSRQPGAAVPRISLIYGCDSPHRRWPR